MAQNLGLIVNVLESVNYIKPSGGVNPVDASPQTLHNIRGQMRYTIISQDNSYTSIFDVIGGYGRYYTDPTQNFTYIGGSNVNCTVTVPVLNTIRVTTPVADAGGRVYDVVFTPIQSTAPTIEQTSGNVIGNNILEVRSTRWSPNIY